MIWVVNLKKVK